MRNYIIVVCIYMPYKIFLSTYNLLRCMFDISMARKKKYTIILVQFKQYDPS